MKWIEKLYHIGLDGEYPAETIEVFSEFPGLLEKHLMPLIQTYGYKSPVIKVASNTSKTIILDLEFVSEKVNRKFVISLLFNQEYLFFTAIIRKITDTEWWEDVNLRDYFKMEQSVDPANFDLNQYTGTIEEKLKAFINWLIERLNISGIDYVTGDAWSYKYAGINQYK